jgi:hypothetical protein
MLKISLHPRGIFHAHCSTYLLFSTFRHPSDTPKFVASNCSFNDGNTYKHFVIPFVVIFVQSLSWLMSLKWGLFLCNLSTGILRYHQIYDAPPSKLCKNVKNVRHEINERRFLYTAHWFRQRHLLSRCLTRKQLHSVAELTVPWKGLIEHVNISPIMEDHNCSRKWILEIRQIINLK